MMKGALFVILGLALMIGTAFEVRGVGRFRAEALRAPGVVERLNAGGSHPEIGFTTAGGERISYPQGGMIAGYRPGDRVTVLYRPACPGRCAQIDRFGALWAFPLMTGILGAVFALAGALLWRDGRRPQ